MSATNSTANYELPIFLATDKPAWLTDWNGAMNAIDSAIHSAQSTADGAQTTAGTAIADIATINASLTTITGNITSLTTTVNGNTGSINTINSLIGNGQPTTEDKTLIGAINEIYAMIGGGTDVDADIVAYDNTTSGLTATNVQSAIDELASAPAPQGYDLDTTAFTGSANPTSTAGTIYSYSTDVTYGLNADKSIMQIYGGITILTAALAQQGDNVISSISIADMPALASNKVFCIGCLSLGSTYILLKIRFNTDKTIDIIAVSDGAYTNQNIIASLPNTYYLL